RARPSPRWSGRRAGQGRRSAGSSPRSRRVRFTTTAELVAVVHRGGAQLQQGRGYGASDVAAVAAADLEQGVGDLAERAAPHRVHQDVEQVVAGEGGLAEPIQ